MNARLKISSSVLRNGIFLIYLIALAIVNTKHETWRDEVQAFLLVRESHSFSELFFNTRYEGHPSLWFIILFLFKYVWPSIVGMKTLHFFISAFASWLFWQYSPFKLLHKIAILFGYYLFFEYGCIVRDYSLGICFVFAFCVLYSKPKGKKHMIWLSLLIVAMMMSNFYSFFLGIAFTFLLFYNWSMERSLVSTKKVFIAAIIILTGAVLFLFDTLPPADYGYAKGFTNEFHIEDVRVLFGQICRVFLPIPPQSQFFWNDNFISNSYVLCALGIVILFGIFGLFGKRVAIRATLILIFFQIMLFSYLKFPGYLRHNGHLFIGFLALLWIETSTGESSLSKKLPNILFTGLVLVQFIAAMIVVERELKNPFSESKNAAEFILEKFSNHIVLAHEDASGSAVSAYLPEKIYYPSSKRFGNYMIWNTERMEREVSFDDLVWQGDSLNKLRGRPVLYLFNFVPKNPEGLVLQKAFTGEIEPAEQYYLYTRKMK